MKVSVVNVSNTTQTLHIPAPAVTTLVDFSCLQAGWDEIIKVLAGSVTVWVYWVDVCLGDREVSGEGGGS